MIVSYARTPRRHRKEISTNAEFRRDFQIMCAQNGVDPLACAAAGASFCGRVPAVNHSRLPRAVPGARRGFWSELLGLNDFYYELGVQVVDVCLATRAHTGGLHDMADVLARVRRRRARTAPAVAADDLERAVARLAVLGGGYRVVSIGGRRVLQSVPAELSTDATAVLGVAAGAGPAAANRTTVAAAAAALAWPAARAAAALERLLADGAAWADDQDPAGQRVFWFPGLAAAS